MNNLTKEETVWLQAFKSYAESQNRSGAIAQADEVLKVFKGRFPTPQKEPVSTLTQKESVSGLTQERSDFWINCNHEPDINGFLTAKISEPNYPSGWVQVTTLRDGEVVVSRENLAKAWDEKRGTHGPHDFDRFCKALGLK